jgi:multicomponent K+:H+ antiporter subunit F
MIVATLLPFAIGAFTLALLLNLYRLLRGPGLADRILALDTLYINSLALLILVGIRFDTTVFFEAALVIAALGFVGTVALSKFVVRGDIVE